VVHRGRTVLAMDCALAGAEQHRGRPLNSIVRQHSQPPSCFHRSLFWPHFGSKVRLSRICDVSHN
jgi:hypothetical protein